MKRKTRTNDDASLQHLVTSDRTPPKQSEGFNEEKGKLERVL
jgi:hypothetical protein